MRAFARLEKPCAGAAAVLAVALSGWVLLAAASAGVAQEQAVSAAVLPNLLAGADDLPPFDLILVKAEVNEDGARPVLEQAWAGRLTGGRGCLRSGATCEEYDRCTCHKTANEAVKARVTLAVSPEQAGEFVRRYLLPGVAQPPEEVAEGSIAALGDHVWYGDTARHGSGDAPKGGRLILVRHNAVLDVCVSHKDGFDPQLLVDLAARLGRKIDAAAAGRPEPPPLLPPSAEEMHLDLEGAWAAYQSGKLLAPGGTSLALQRGRNLPRSMPAKQVAKREFVVPLAQLAGAMGATERVKVQGNRASVKLPGGRVTVTQGKAQAKYGTRTITLTRPVEFRRGQVLVPLSITEKVLGRKISWQKKGRLMLARL